MKTIEPVYPLLGKWTQQQREKIALSQKTLADMLGISEHSIERIEKGEVRVLLHIYTALRQLLDDDKLELTKDKARLFYVAPPSQTPKRKGRGPANTPESFRERGERLREAYLNGVPMRILGIKEGGLSIGTVRKSLQSAGVTVRKPGHMRTFPDQAFTIKEGVWSAVWRGKVAAADFSSKGAAEAWIRSCDAAGKLRA